MGTEKANRSGLLYFVVQSTLYLQTSNAEIILVLSKILGKGLLYCVGGPVAILVLIAATVLIGGSIEHRFATEFPKPTGPYAVGRTMYHWIDDGHDDEFAPNSGTKRELVVWAWYPAAVSGSRAEYLPSRWQAALSESSGGLMSKVLTRDLARAHIYSTENAALSPDRKPYPVLILRAGASALVTGYTALAEDLASHGYVVVGPDAPFRTAVVVLPDGRSLHRLAQNDVEEQPEGQKVALATRLAGSWSTDIAFVLDKMASLNAGDSAGRFTGRLDLQHVGVFGHSLGGATAAYFCRVDARCQAGVDLDGRLFGPVVETGLTQPFMFILEGHGSAEGETGKILAQIDSMYSHLPANSRLKVSIAGSNHFSFTDQILLKSQVLLGLMRQTHVLGGLDGRRGLAITSDYLCTFFDVYLKGSPPAALEALRKKYPEAVVD